MMLMHVREAMDLIRRDMENKGGEIRRHTDATSRVTKPHRLKGSSHRNPSRMGTIKRNEKMIISDTDP